MAVTSLRRPDCLTASDPLLTFEEAAAYLKIAQGTLKHWVVWKRIEHVKLGKLTRFRQSALDTFISAQTVAVA